LAPGRFLLRLIGYAVENSHAEFRMTARVIFVVLGMVALTMGRAAGAQSSIRTTAINGRPTCANCRVVLEKVATLETPDNVDPILVDVEIARSSKGMYVASAMNHFQLLVFDATGKFVRTIGRKGQGPGEFAFVQMIRFGPGDSLRVFERSRVHVFTPDFRFVRTFAKTASVIGAIVQSDGSTLVHVDQRRGVKSPPVHVMNSAGTLTRSFGTPIDSALMERCRPCRTDVFELQQAGGVVGVGPNNRYAFEIWTQTGTLKGSYAITSPWFKDWDENAPSWLKGEGPRPSSMTQAAVDENGRVWAKLVRSPPDWKVSTHVPSRAGVRMGESGVSASSQARLAEYMAELLRMQQSVIEIIDLKQGAVHSSTVFNGDPVMFLTYPYAMRKREDADGETHIDIFRMREEVAR
jgi:hypothetical protein